jgi:hypothetical protein
MHSHPIRILLLGHAVLERGGYDSSSHCEDEWNDFWDGTDDEDGELEG